MILRRYLCREILQSTAAVLAVLVVVYAAHRYVRYLTEAASGRISNELILELLALKLVENSVILIPLALYFGILLGLGRLYRDSEMVAMAAGGARTRILVGSVLALGAGAAVVVAVLALYLAPRVSEVQAGLWARAKGEVDLAMVIPGRFREFGGGSQVLYAEQLDEDGVMRNVFIQVRRGEGEDLMLARRAYLAFPDGGGDRYLVLEDGRRYSGDPGSVEYVITRFERQAIRLDAEGPEVVRRLQGIGTRELIGVGGAAHWAELQWRISQPLAVLLLAALAVPLARTTAREGRYARLLVATVVYFLYNNAVAVAQKLVERGDLAVAVGVWPAHIALAALALALLYRQAGGRLGFSPRARPRGGPAA